MLDEWSNGRPSTVKLEQKTYKPVYGEILSAMAAVENNRIDGPRLRERLAAWAGFGMYVLTPSITSLTDPHNSTGQ